MSTTTATIDFQPLAQGLGLQIGQFESVVELLDEHNTVPFITRYRKDQTGGLDEEQIRAVEAAVTKARLLSQRKQTILRSIESQGKLTPQLSTSIEAADTFRRLEDLYLPFRPKKQTRATAARERGLEPLADEIISADPACADLDARAADFVSTDRGVPTAAEALLGAGHILAERFHEQADLRTRLREIFERTGKLVSVATAKEKAETEQAPKPTATAKKTPSPTETESSSPSDTTPSQAEPEPKQEPAKTEPAVELATPAVSDSPEPSESAPQEAPASAEAAPSSAASESPAEETTNVETAAPKPSDPEATSQEPATAVEMPDAAAPLESEAPPKQPAEQLQPEGGGTAEASSPAAAAEGGKSLPEPTEVKPAREKRKKKPDKKKDNKKKPFSDYLDFSEAVHKVPPHRVLAINRGERSKVLRVRIDADTDRMQQVTEEMVAPADHPHADFLKGCARDALQRLVLPSLEREMRRELTEAAEQHAVDVFARNLRNLLLQPPVRGKRLLAIDPGYKSGCKVVALDEFGSLIANEVVFITGKQERRDASKARLLELMKEHNLTIVAIGNGTACRETEAMIAELIAAEFADTDVAYVIVNEAGASVYSASSVGRDEFPDLDATVRGSISIGRRLQDPLSELVKIDPANIGVGMYQHDVKAKHLQTSLDSVVESAVNYVGVNVNTASVSLLRYVSGLNHLTARRVFEHRQQRGPFKTREELREVQSLGDASFVQSAGFLRIPKGECPWDATWIHPESYADAQRVLEKLGFSPDQLADREQAEAIAAKARETQASLAMAEELGVGEHLLRDILTQLSRPGHDPREELPPPLFRRDLLKLDDLSPGMELTGSVLNVVDFGVFVDIGLKDSGLVHISQLSADYVADPHKVVAVGDVVRVWVLNVDKERRRVSLTRIPPGTERSRPSRPKRKSSEQRKSQPDKQSGGGKRSRPPQRGKGKDRGRGASRPQGPFETRTKAPPPKLTKEMEEGKAPLRSFGELMKFMEKDEEEDKEQGAEKDKK